MPKSSSKYLRTHTVSILREDVPAFRQHLSGLDVRPALTKKGPTQSFGLYQPASIVFSVDQYEERWRELFAALIPYKVTFHKYRANNHRWSWFSLQGKHLRIAPLTTHGDIDWDNQAEYRKIYKTLQLIRGDHGSGSRKETTQQG